MASYYSLMELPDLVLYNICTFVTCPFDLLYLGNTCSRLRRVSSSPSLWWYLALRWFKGLWILMEEGSTEDRARDWMLDMMRLYSAKPSFTKSECLFENGERWHRADSRKFRFLFYMIRVAYAKDKDDHPAVLFEQWLYDIGVFQRSGPLHNYSAHDLQFSQNAILQLSSLGQASERDLQRRKQPYKDPKYYIKRIAVTESSSVCNLFSQGRHGSICPLLMCPLQGAVTNEVSDIQGLAMCLSVVLERHLKKRLKPSALPLQKLWEMVKVFCTVFVSDLFFHLPGLKARMETFTWKGAVLTIVAENRYDYTQLQNILQHFNVNLDPKVIISDFVAFLRKIEGIDFVVDEIRFHLRKAINEEIGSVLLPPVATNTFVTRINLTDSDLIGGDNSRQEMSAAAFISDHGVLVTWHLTGRMRY